MTTAGHIQGPADTLSSAAPPPLLKISGCALLSVEVQGDPEKRILRVETLKREREIVRTAFLFASAWIVKSKSLHQLSYKFGNNIKYTGYSIIINYHWQHYASYRASYRFLTVSKFSKLSRGLWQKETKCHWKVKQLAFYYKKINANEDDDNKRPSIVFIDRVISTLWRPLGVCLGTMSKDYNGGDFSLSQKRYSSEFNLHWVWQPLQR